MAGDLTKPEHPEEVKELEEKFEVYCDFSGFRHNTILILLRKEKQEQLECEKTKEAEVAAKGEKECEERLEVCCNLPFSQQNAILTPLRKEKRRTELEYEEEEEEATGDAGEAKETYKAGLLTPAHSFIHSEALPLLPTPTNFVARDEIMPELLHHLDGLVSIVLLGAVGIGKTAVALALLHHDHAQTKFSRTRHFMRCDDLADGLEPFLERLSDAIGLSPTRNMEELRLYLKHLPPLMLILDGVECILDPLGKESKQICAAIEEISQYRDVCLLATSRMAVNIRGFRTIEVGALSQDKARDIFYGLCCLDRSPAVDDLLGSLDSHPLSIDLLARTTFENGWDESRLLQEWDDNQTDVMKVANRQSLGDAIESALASPTIRSLGSAAHETLQAFAVFPDGLEATKVGRVFPTIGGVEEVVNVLCKFRLLDHRDGVVKMLSPFRFYFLQFVLPTVPIYEDEESHHSITIGGEGDGICHPSRPGSSSHSQCNCGIDVFRRLPRVYCWPGQEKP